MWWELGPISFFGQCTSSCPDIIFWKDYSFPVDLSWYPCGNQLTIYVAMWCFISVCSLLLILKNLSSRPWLFPVASVRFSFQTSHELAPDLVGLLAVSTLGHVHRRLQQAGLASPQGPGFQRDERGIAGSLEFLLGVSWHHVCHTFLVKASHKSAQIRRVRRYITPFEGRSCKDSSKNLWPFLIQSNF